MRQDTHPVKTTYLLGQLLQPFRRITHWFDRMPARWFGFVLLVPAIIMVLSLYLYPLGYTMVGSLQNKDPYGGESPFVGLANYETVLSRSETWNAFRNGIIYAGSTVSLQVILGLAIAQLLKQRFYGNLILRSLLIMPYILAPVGSALVWKWLLNDVLGIANVILSRLGVIRESIAFLGDPRYALATVIGISVWKLFPFVTICILARLETIPEELYDAGKVDGANAINRFIHITLPQLKGVLFVVLLLRSIWMFNDFETIWLLTRGGPIDRTTNLPILAYLHAFTGSFQVSLGMAVTVLMLLFLIIMAVIYFRIYNVEEEIS